MAASGEVRVMAEGTLWWVQASGSGRTWATAASVPSGQFGYIQEGMTFTSAKEMVAIMERGVPDHWKTVGFSPIDVSFSLLLGISGVPPILTASGTTTPMLHIEHRASAQELGASGTYFQFMGVPLHSLKWTENKNGNKIDFTFKALAMVGPTGSGYIK